MPQFPPIGRAAGALSLALAAAAPAQTCNIWTPLSGNPWAPLTTDRAAAFHGALGAVIVFGGYIQSSQTYLADTIMFDGTAWTPIFNGPGARRAPSLAYDAARQNCVLFGGAISALNAVGDTWTLGAGGWVLRSSMGGPSPRGYSPMVYDSGRQVCIIFGGEGPNGVKLSDTWEWNGSVWAQRSGGGPIPRSNHSMAYDPVRARTVLFGGWSQGNVDTGTTYEWDGTTWSLRASSGVPARANAGMTYDPIVGGVVLSGGTTGSTSWQDAWLWNGTTWSSFTALPQARSRHAMVHDPLRARTYALGGNSIPFGLALSVGYPVSITEHPASSSVVPGQSVSFSVVASSQSPISYQWRKDQQDIPGATSPTYSIAAATPADQGSYDVLVTTGCNPTYSSPAVLTVQCGAVITQQPQSLAAAPGAVAAFGVTVANAAPSYQWRKDGNPIAGATGAFYSFTVAGTQDEGQYDVVVTTPCGPLPSAAATLTVGQPCYPNCDHSTIPPILNVLDFSCFLNRFAQGCP